MPLNSKDPRAVCSPSVSGACARRGTLSLPFTRHRRKVFHRGSASPVVRAGEIVLSYIRRDDIEIIIFFYNFIFIFVFSTRSVSGENNLSGLRSQGSNFSHSNNRVADSSRLGSYLMRLSRSMLLIKRLPIRRTAQDVSGKEPKEKLRKSPCSRSLLMLSLYNFFEQPCSNTE